MSLPRNPRRQFEPLPLTYAQQQGRWFAEEAFLRATNQLYERTDDLTYDDHLNAYGELLEQIVLKEDRSIELMIFTSAERRLWASQAIETVIDETRLIFLRSIRHIEARGQFAPGLHENIGLVRLYLTSRSIREASSFDALIAAPA